MRSVILIVLVAVSTRAQEPTREQDTAPPQAVAGLELVGVQSVDERQLRDLLATRSPSWISWAALAAFAAGDWRSPWRIQIGDLLYDGGVGVQFRSPFGLVRADVGYQLTPIEGLRVDGHAQDQRWRVHFSIGESF